MRVSDLRYDVFQDYKIPSMLIGAAFCDWKCCINGTECQNRISINRKITIITPQELFIKYKKLTISKAIVFGGLEPFLQLEEVIEIIEYFRNNNCMDDIIIYTGYYLHEVLEGVEKLKKYPNIIIKFGRYILKDIPIYDKVLGITLASSNQYAERIS